MLPIIEYNKNHVLFDQDECRICLTSFQENERVTELACKHIFHPECIPASIIKCPKCLTDIKERVKKYSEEEIAKLVNEVGFHLLANLEKTKKNEEFIETVCQLVTRYLVDYYKNTTIRSYYDPVTILQESLGTLKVINEKAPDETILRRHTNYGVGLIEQWHQNKPVTSSSDCDRDIFDGFLIMCSLFGVPRNITNYVYKVLKNVKEHPKTKEIFRTRTNILRMKLYKEISQLGSCRRLLYVMRLDDHSRKLVSKSTKAKTALKVSKCVNIVLAVGLTISVTAMLID